jgi:pyruvate formate lyase activating enzyme
MAGINTAIESTGFTKFEIIEEKILPHLDLFLMDIKHISSAKHKLFTGKPNERVLENARKIAESGQHLIIRVPVIPTFNATEQEIFEIAQFARSLKGVEEIHLLPYHRLGIDKYGGLGREYSLMDLEPPSDETMEQLRNIAKTTGLKVKIGG